MTEAEMDIIIEDDSTEGWTDLDADKALRYIAYLERDKVTWKDYYAEQLRKVNEQIDGRIAWKKRQLQDYFGKVPHKATKTQESYALPSGKLVYKQQEPEYRRDDAVLLPWLKDNAPELVKVEEKPDWAGLKKVLTVLAPDDMTSSVADGNGEIVPGIEAVQRDPVFQAVPAKGKGGDA